jgi:GAF domain-containing protein
MFIYDSSISIVKQLDSLIGEENNPIANMANFSAFLYGALPDLNWCGFYLQDPVVSDKIHKELVLGPFQGGPACIRIPFGKGVCGTAAQKKEKQIVDDVEKFPGHIACDSATRSELVIPIVKDDDTIGVLDIDSPKLARFDSETVETIEKTIAILVERTDWNMLFRTHK